MQQVCYQCDACYKRYFSEDAHFLIFRDNSSGFSGHSQDTVHFCNSTCEQKFNEYVLAQQGR